MIFDSLKTVTILMAFLTPTKAPLPQQGTPVTPDDANATYLSDTEEIYDPMHINDPIHGIAFFRHLDAPL